MLDKPSLGYYKKHLQVELDNIEALYGRDAAVLVIKETGYLDDTEQPKKLSEATWNYRWDKPGLCCVYNDEDYYGPIIASNIPSLALAQAIAALPDLAKACRYSLERLQKMGPISRIKHNVDRVFDQLEEVLEKAGEIL